MSNFVETRRPIKRTRLIRFIPARWELRLGIVGVLGLLIVVIFAPLIATHDPNYQDLVHPFAPWSLEHLMGTDDLGRDVFSRLIYGARTDLRVAFIAVLIPVVIGTVLGAACGYFGGWFDQIIMRLADVVVAFPFYIIVIVLVFVMGNGEASVYIGISAVSWVAYCRISRAEALVVRQKEYISAARTVGLSRLSILFRHVVPNVSSQSIVYAMSDIVLDIGVIVTLSYFGMGIVPPTPDWGQMMSHGQQFLISGQYSLMLLPAACVALTSIILALLGDGLADLLDERN